MARIMFYKGLNYWPTLKHDKYWDIWISNYPPPLFWVGNYLSIPDSVLANLCLQYKSHVCSCGVKNKNISSDNGVYNTWQQLRS